VTHGRVLLINPPYQFPYRGSMYPSGGLLSIGTVLRKAGFDVSLCHMQPDGVDDDSLVRYARCYRPDVIGLTVTTYQVRSTQRLTQLLREALPYAPLVLGGPHVSAVGEASFAQFPNADVIAIGEGEQTMLEFCLGEPWEEIDGLCYRDGDTVVRTTPREQIANIDALPSLDYDLVDLGRFRGPPPSVSLRSMALMASRGCPFRCAFCSKAVFGQTVRLHSPERVVHEIERLHFRYGIEEIFLHDDTFNWRPDWTTTILETLIRKGLNRIHYKVPMRCNERLVDEELLSLARRAGVWLIFYGVESGNQEMLDNMRKDLSLYEIERAFKLTRQAGIRTIASMIIGFPGETLTTLQQSQAFINLLQPDWVGWSRLVPFPGTPVADEVRQHGWLLDDDLAQYEPGRMLVRTAALDAASLDTWARNLNHDGLRHNTDLMLRHPLLAYQTMRRLTG